MKTLKLKHQLVQLDQALIELDNDERNYRDIINNTRNAIKMDLAWVSECESLGRDDRDEVLFTITNTRKRLRWLEAHPHFAGDLVDLRIAMDGIPDTEREGWNPYDTILPPERESGEWLL